MNPPAEPKCGPAVAWGAPLWCRPGRAYNQVFTLSPVCLFAAESPLMPRRYIAQLTHQEPVDEVFIASNKQLRPNRNGNLYLQFCISDRTGTIDARMWNAGQNVYRSFENGDYVRVRGTAQVYQGAVQVIATQIMRVDPSEVREEDFLQVPSAEVEKLLARLAELLRGMGDPALRNLAECFLLDEQLMDRLARAPAAVRHHHAYRGGLLEHVVTVMEAALRICPCYPQLNRDLLLCGAFLHDIGKLDELSYDRELAYTDEGQLIGHVVMGIGMLEAKLAEAERLSGEAVPQETALRLKHMLVSHHGLYEHGSPRLPMTPEALALHCLDYLDAKLNAFTNLIESDPNEDSSWTTFHPNLSRKLYKGPPGREDRISGSGRSAAGQ